MRWVQTKEKCGVDFVYLCESCGKTRTETNDAIPHTWIVWVMHQKEHSHTTTQEVSAIRPSISSENYHIFT